MNINNNNYSTKLFKKFTQETDIFPEIETITPLNFTELIDLFGNDYKSLINNNEIHDIYGREEEIVNIIEILLRYTINNPLLIGESGIGKTSIIHLFAKKLINNLVPFILLEKNLIELNLSKAAYNAQITEIQPSIYQQLREEILNNKSFIIFIDDIHNLFVGELSNNTLANIIKPMLFENKFQCIGITTTSNYKTLFEKENIFTKFFYPLFIKELSILDSINAVNKIKFKLELFHNIEILPEAIKKAAELSPYYFVDKFLPIKIIDLLDKISTKEIVKITTLTNKSNIINSLLNNFFLTLDKLRLIAFKKKNIAAEFLFQEIENSYKNFFIRWLKSPLNIPTNIISKSPLSNEILKNIKSAIINDIDKLLFSSAFYPNINIIKKNYRDLSINTNKYIFNIIYINIKKKQKINLSLYRIILFIFISYYFKKTNNILFNNLFINNKKLYIIFKNYIINLIINDLINNKTKYYKTDFDKIQTLHQNLTQNEQITINIFNNSLLKIQPIIKKILNNFIINSTAFELSKLELKTINILLGYSIIHKIRPIDFSVLTQKKKQLTENDIITTVAELTNIPLKSITIEESTKLMNLESILHERVVGQDDAISAIAKAIRRSRLGVQNPNRPLASFFFCGPTGVGKTEITKALAEVMFGSEKELIRFDMSEFMEKHNLSRLIGSPPGYIGYDDGGQLTDSVKRKPYSVVLFDELEKAHKDILNILLQILEDGILTDSKKQTVYFNNTLIVLTSNSASADIQTYIKKNPKISQNIKDNNLNNISNNSIINNNNYNDIIKFFKSSLINNFLKNIKNELNNEYNKSFLINNKQTITFKNNLSVITEITESELTYQDKLTEHIKEALSEEFLPEFLNRLDNIIVFLPLTIEQLHKIFDIMIKNLNKRLKTQNITIFVDDFVKQKICQKSNQPFYGARPLRREITKNIEDRITDYIVQNPLNLNPKFLKIILDPKNINNFIVKE